MIRVTATRALLCPFCRAALDDGERLGACGRCGTRHHLECLAIHGGCAVHGCAGSPIEDDMNDEWTINENDPVPIGDQIGFRILYAIARGVYRPGDKLPTVRDVATRLRVNPNTVSKAYRDLERDGLLNSRRGTGVFVNEGALQMALERRQALVLGRFERAVAEALDAGLEPEEVSDVVSQALAREVRARQRSAALQEHVSNDAPRGVKEGEHGR